jgi:MoxR-like ATPase
VLATQNPIEQEGTYPLPEAQLDRFMFLIDVDYPTEQEADELEIVKRTTTDTDQPVSPVLDPERILALQSMVRRMPHNDIAVQYAVDLVRATRPDDPSAPPFIKEYVSWGAGPRASQYLILASKARALLAGRETYGREDIRAVARPVLVHRVLTNFHAEAERVTSARIIDRLLEAMPGR